MAFDYPQAKRVEHTDDYHGTKIADPYVWLEDPDSPETKAFVDAQNEISVPYLQTEARNKFKQRMTKLFNFPKRGCPFRRGDKYYHYYNTGLQNHFALYQLDSLDGEPKLFLDPNTLSEDGTTALKSVAFSKDGKNMAYSLSKSGSDWATIHIRDTTTGKDHDEVLHWVKFSCLSWTHDHRGFFYNRYNPPAKEGVDAGTETDINLDQKLYYHVLGTPQSEDILCYETPDQPKWMIGAEVTEDGEYVLLSISEGCDPVNRLYYSKIDGHISQRLEPIKLVDNFDAEYCYIANKGTEFTFKTNLKAPNYKLIRADITSADLEWRDILPEQKSVLESVDWVNHDYLVACYLEDVKNVLKVHSMAGDYVRDLPLPVGTVASFTCHHDDPEVFFKFTSFLHPGTIFQCSFDSDAGMEPKLFYETEVEGFDSNNFETKQVFYNSKDGTRIPMFLVYPKGIKMDGNNPTLLYGYGGFNISVTPGFSVGRLIFCQNLGGVLAVANIRGGGEYGEVWHKAGSLATKQNCFDDFQAAAEFLCKEKYTQPSRLAIQGGSNGGLLVGACINQRPDLFGCAIAKVGVMDMLKFHKFTIGHAWTTDFGCSDKPEQFEWLIKYSPLHNVKHQEGVQYPATLLTTGDHDDRVVPLHSLKFIATLQHELGSAANQTNPIIIRVETKAGHGAGKPTEKQIEEVSDDYGFIARTLDIEWRE